MSRRRPPDRRDYAMTYLREFCGMTLEEVGNEFGLSRERTRQILARAGSPARSSEVEETALRRAAHAERHAIKEVRYVTRTERAWKRCTICDGSHHHSGSSSCLHTFLTDSGLY